MSTNDAVIPTIPAALPVGEARPLMIDGEHVVVVGSEPSGFAVVMCAADWARLQRFKLTRLRIGRFGVCAIDGRNSRLVVRFINDIDWQPGLDVLFRNGNRLDLRRSNVVLMSRSTIVSARRRDAVPVGITRFKNGRKRPRDFVSATEKVEAALND